MEEFIKNSLGAGAHQELAATKSSVKPTRSIDNNPSLALAENSDFLDIHVEEVLKWVRSEDSEVPLYLRNELLEALRRLDIVGELRPKIYPSVPVNVLDAHIDNVRNVTGEFHAGRLLSFLRGKDRHQISPEVRKELMDALRSL